MLEEKLKNIKKEIINFFKSPKEIISFFLPIILVLCLFIPVPYYIKLGGGTLPLDEKIVVENEYKSKGSFNSLYVSETKGNVLLLLLSYVVPSFERVDENKVTLDNEKEKDYDNRERIYFDQSSDNALKVAFDKAGKNVEIDKNSFLVMYIDKNAKTTLKVGDNILKVDSKEMKDHKTIENIIKSKDIGSSINMLVLRDKKKVNTKSEIINIDNSPKIGVAISNVKTYKTEDNVTFNFNKSVAGPSGGLMIALSIYNKITKEDITDGKTIMGTGTIDSNGIVGEVGGIKHKLKGAEKKNADIVLVPEGNYKEALKVKKDKQYKFKLIKVKNFDEAIKKLKN